MRGFFLKLLSLSQENEMSFSHHFSMFQCIFSNFYASFVAVATQVYYVKLKLKVGISKYKFGANLLI